MRNVLKTDLYRILKSKLLIIILCVAILLPLFTVLLYYAIYKTISSSDAQELAAMALGFNTRSIITSCYSLTNNVGLLLPVFSAVMVSRDLSSGLLRNKIICGHSRAQVYFSHLITSMLFNIIVMFVYFFASLGFSRIFFEYGAEFNKTEFMTILFYVINGTVVFMFISTITNIFALNFKTLPPIIILTITVSFILNVFVSIMSLVELEKYKYILYLIPTYSLTIFRSMPSFDTIMFIEALIGLVVLGTFNTLLGFAIFRNKEIK